MLGVATLNPQGITGAGLQMFSHGAMTALFFACVGIVYDRAHTRDIPSLGGMASKLPWVTVAFIIGGLVSMGMPGFSGFIAELPIMLGLWEAGNATSEYFIAPYYTWIVMIAVVAIVITASYILRVVQRVFFGQMPAEFEGHISQSTWMDKTAIVMLAAVLVLLGVFPGLMAPLISSGAKNVLAVIGGM
jgi:NADH-quinone oxidoreductase subunit M